MVLYKTYECSFLQFFYVSLSKPGKILKTETEFFKSRRVWCQVFRGESGQSVEGKQQTLHMGELQDGEGFFNFGGFTKGDGWERHEFLKEEITIYTNVKNKIDIQGFQN